MMLWSPAEVFGWVSVPECARPRAKFTSQSPRQVIRVSFYHFTGYPVDQHLRCLNIYTSQEESLTIRYPWTCVVRMGPVRNHDSGVHHTGAPWLQPDRLLKQLSNVCDNLLQSRVCMTRHKGTFITLLRKEAVKCYGIYTFYHTSTMNKMISIILLSESFHLEVEIQFKNLVLSQVHNCF